MKAQAVRARWTKACLNNILTKESAETRKKNIKNEKKCRNGMPKSTQTRKDKSDGKYTKPRPYIFTLL